MKSDLYILVADAGQAKVFSARKPLHQLEQVSNFEHAESRLTTSETYSDRPGRQQNDFAGSHSFAGDLQTHETEKFASELCQFLDSEHAANKYSGLLLVASPKLLGELRKHLTKACSDCLVDSIDKDIVHLPDAELAEHLARYVEPAG